MYSEFIERTIAQARELGLVVEIEDKTDDPILQSVSVRVARPRVEAQNMLDVVNNAELITVHSVRTYNRGKWSHTARSYSYTDYRGTERSLRSVKYRLEGMTD